MTLTPQDVQKIRRLASGDVEPLTGFERHFVRVCRGEARPLTDEERMWFSIVQGDFSKDLASINNGELENIKAQFEDLQKLNESLKIRINLLENSTTELREKLLISSQAQQSIKAKCQNLELALDASNCERSELIKKVSEYEINIKMLEGEIIDEVERRLPAHILRIQENAEMVQKININLAHHNDKLSDTLKNFLPAYVICTECEGKGKWSLRDVTGDGVGFEHGAIIEVCEKCHGLGKWENPERKRLGIPMPPKR